ncbi:C-type lectin domain family 10 member A-like isoform X2 [Pangasianodon hypophthalmus]|uniref:C-type lectin domain family 10 member A-like isoform X2 n=1 Tax=Pangasianodon hypophthalmus TaxID=310915 RepID=UPI0014801D50|nr:C-type lectin domain family 10 member A-like isoform X2 [Pangasianodon hypophthalmus]
MANSENHGKGTCNELQIQDNGDVCSLYSDKTKFAVRDELSSRPYRLAAIVLGVLSAVFLLLVIGLSVHINRVSDKHDILSLNSSINCSQLVQLQSDHRSLTESKNALQNQHDEDVKMIKSLQTNLSRETRLKNELILQNQKLEEDVRKMQSQISNLEGNCGKCLPNWVQMGSTCFYFDVSSTIPSKGWKESRDECKKKGADLVIIDSKEKQEFIIKNLKELKQSFSYYNGFWIGLKDDHTEGIWKWLNDATLTQGYWMDGEPNDERGIEDCAAVYSTNNPMKAWNDAPCSHPLKWICEKEINKTF